MTWLFYVKLGFLPAVLFGSIDFQSLPPQKTNVDRRTQSATKMKANECSF